MKRVTIYFFLAAILGIFACAISGGLAIGHSLETAAQLAAGEMSRPPSSSEVIANSLDRRIPKEEKGGGFLATVGGLSLLLIAIGARFLYFYLKANYLRQSRLNTRANIQARQPGPVPRAPRLMLPDQNLHNRGSDDDQIH